MNRKIWFALCLTFITAIRIHEHITGKAVDYGMLLEPLLILWAAFVLPAVMPVFLIERHLFHLDPWADGNDTLSLVWLLLTASFLWFFPADRVARWFGSFDAFKEGPRRFARLPTLSEIGAGVLDKIARARVGKGKMGGWA